MAFNGRFVLNLIEFATKLGAPKDKLVALTGKSEEVLKQEACTLDNIHYNAVVEGAVEYSGDLFLGLHAGENLNLSAAGLILQIAQTSETVQQALNYSCQFANLGCSAMPHTLVEASDHYRLIMTPNLLWQKQSRLAVQHTAEGMLAFMLRQFRTLTLTKHNPLAIHVPWRAPADTSEYGRVFETSVYFEQEEIAILLKKMHVEDQIHTSDYNLQRILVAYAEEKSARLKQESGYMPTVKEAMVRLIKPAFPRIDQVASHLNVSQRTLQRRLKAEGYVYKQLLDELRQEFAEGYLKRADLSVSEVAQLLNYADTSTFSRSFKRWMGKTPSEYRAVMR